MGRYLTCLTDEIWGTCKRKLTLLLPRHHLFLLAADAQHGQEDCAAHGGDQDHDEEDAVHLAHLEDLRLDLDDGRLAHVQAVGARAGRLREGGKGLMME